MLLSLQTYVSVILIVVIVLQYAFALICLLKLAYFDVPKTHYILWNLFILIVFFIGGIAFLIYYYMHPDKHIAPATDAALPDQADAAENAEQADAAENAEQTAAPEAASEQADNDGEAQDRSDPNKPE